MNLLQIALFLQSTDNTVICQPQVNYRPLSISNIKTKRFIENMEGTTGDLNEEMYVIYMKLQTSNKQEKQSLSILFIPPMKKV
jgi:hypothetical protein